MTEPAVPDYQAAAGIRAQLRRLASMTEHVARRHGLTSHRYELLLFIQAAADNGTPATITSLCEPLQTTQGSVTQLVSGAIRAGLLERTPTPGDRRSHQLRLTEIGAERLANVYNTLGPERDRLAAIIEQNLGRPG